MDTDKVMENIAVDWGVPVNLLKGSSVNNDESPYSDAVNNLSKGIEEIKAQMIKSGIEVEL